VCLCSVARHPVCTHPPTHPLSPTNTQSHTCRHRHHHIHMLPPQSTSYPAAAVRCEQLDIDYIDGMLLLPLIVEHTIGGRGRGGRRDDGGRVLHRWHAAAAPHMHGTRSVRHGCKGQQAMPSSHEAYPPPAPCRGNKLSRVFAAAACNCFRLPLCCADERSPLCGHTYESLAVRSDSPPQSCSATWLSNRAVPLPPVWGR
jgi:hypothetical protein